MYLNIASSLCHTLASYCEPSFEGTCNPRSRNTLAMSRRLMVLRLDVCVDMLSCNNIMYMWYYYCDSCQFNFHCSVTGFCIILATTRLSDIQIWNQCSKGLPTTICFSTAPSHRNGRQGCIHSLYSNIYKVSSLLQGFCKILYMYVTIASYCSMANYTLTHTHTHTHSSCKSSLQMPT